MRLALRYKSGYGLAAVLLSLPALLVLAAAGARAQQSTPRTETRGTRTAPPDPQGESVIRGRVLYADTGRPLRRAGVAILEAETLRPGRAATTDRRGRFRLDHVPAGRYFIFVHAPGILAPDLTAAVRGPSFVQWITAQAEGGFAEVSVDGKNHVETEVRARRGGVITGRVTTEGDEPVALADIKLLRRERGRLKPVGHTWMRLETDKRSLQTDSRGVYRIAGLPAGEYVVRASDSNLGPDSAGDDDAYADGSFVVAYYPAATSLKDAQAVQVLEGSESAGVDIRLPDAPTHKIGGTLTMGRSREPAGFVSVKIERADEGRTPSALYDFGRRTDEAGRWELNGIPDGEYVIRFGDGGSAKSSTADSSNWVYVAPKVIKVSVAGADVLGLETSLRPGASVSGSAAVEGGAERPSPLIVEAVPVAAGKGAGSPEETRAGAPDSEATTSEAERPDALAGRDETSSTNVRSSGDFELNGLPAGSYTLRVYVGENDRFYVKAVTRDNVDLMRTPVRLAEGASLQGVRVVLATDVATVSGVVTQSAAAGEKPAAGALVILAPADEATRRATDGLVAARADSRGRFTLKCPPGEFFLAAFSRQQLAKRAAPVSEEDFKGDKKFRRVKLRPGEHLKAAGVPVADN